MIAALVWVVNAWSVQALITSCPFTHSLTPSSDIVLKTYCPVTGGRT